MQGEAFDLSGCPDPRTFLCNYLFPVNTRELSALSSSFAVLDEAHLHL